MNTLKALLVYISVVAFLLFAPPGLADDPRALQLAARNGDLAEVKRLVEAGADINGAGPFGNTPLALAAGQGQVEVVRFLLEKGADPDARETFFGMTVLDTALWKGAPEFEVARLLLAKGATGRGSALAEAFKAGDLDFAKHVAASGPVRESEAKELRARFNGLSAELQQVLDTLKTEPDPPPPTYSKSDLAKLAGEFVDRDGVSAVVQAGDTNLKLQIEGTSYTLTPSGEREFSDAEAGVTLSYFGRAGSVEGVSLSRRGADDLRMRYADAPIATTTELPEFVVDPDAKPVVHWPGFRGKNRDGIGDGADTRAEFDLESGDGVLWSIDLPGLGNSSPVIWGERVYVTTAIAKGGSTPLRTGLTGAGDEIEENVEHRWLVLAFDKKSGKKIWESEVGRGKPLTKRHFKATQANSTPVTDGQHIVAVFPTAGLAALDSSGKILWKHELGGLNAGGFNDPGMQWGFASSPILYRGKVILQVDIHEGAYIAAWDLKSGKQLWKTPRPGVAPSWATPAIWPTPNGDELVTNASVIHGYDPETGKELWSLGPTSIQVVAAPVVGSRDVYVSSGYPPSRPIYAVKPGIRGAHQIESDADAEGVLSWHHERGGAYMPTPLLYRGLYYVVHHNGRIAAHDVRTGDIVYRGRFSAGGTCTSSPVAANGKIYQGTEEGTLYVLQAGPEHRELAVHEFGEPLMATPAISEGVVFVRTPSKLIAIGEQP